MRPRRCTVWWVCALAGALVSAELWPACPRGVGPRCVADHGYSLDEANYKVDGEDVNIKFKNGDYFYIMCPENVPLDSPALPRFEKETPVNKVRLYECPAPEHSYGHVLSRLNVLALGTITIVKARQEITSAHLSGLNNISSLELEELSVAPDAFDAFNGTTHLSRIRLTRVKSVEVGRLPTALHHLKLEFTDIRTVSRASLESLPALTKLVMRDNGNISVEVAASLLELALEADAVLLLDHALPNALVNLTLKGWAEHAPIPWKTCKSLQGLSVMNSKINVLLSDWLVNCKELLRLSLKECGLKELPKGLLDNAESLSHLDLTGNLLQELPSGLFAKTRKIEVVDISDNNLTSDAFDAVAASSLRRLELSGNARLGDACRGSAGLPSGLSRLRDLARLRRLALAGTGASAVCLDYRQNMPSLKELDLSDNLITELRLQDLDFRADVRVDLRGNNVTRLLYTWDEYEVLTAKREQYCYDNAPLASRALFDFPVAALQCDCRLAPAARALRDCAGYVRLPPPLCAGGRALADVPLDELLCAAPPQDCGARAPCRCAWRAPRGGGLVRRVTCAGAGLDSAPPAPNATELLLSDNSISTLTRDDLPPSLTVLDLRNNSITRLEPSIVESLPTNGRLWLSGNPLSCDCDDAAVAALLARRDVVADIDSLRCPSGAPLQSAACAPPASALAGALAAPLLLAGLLLGCLARRGARARLKAALRALGCLPPRAEADDDERPYDAFVSFSHLDSAVVRELLERLEGGARPYRVCVHYRDWAPGGWIPEQIAASVRRSRRTLAVVSAHFLGSAWARAEFREAHAAALRDPEPRLVVVLLDEPARLPLDDELRRYLAANTYVRWGDPWFWHKLRAALPPPRGVPAAPGGPGDPGDPHVLQLAGAAA